MPAKKEYKLELWPLLRNISTKNVGYFDTLSEESVKEFQPLVLQRWLTGCPDGKMTTARQIYFLNELVNPYVFVLGNKHKKLIYDLMTMSTSGRDCRYKYVKAKAKRTTNMPKTVAIIKELYGYNNKDANDAIPLISDEYIISAAEQLGKQDAEIKELKKELKTKRPK